METVVEMFRKLGLRQTLVTHKGSVIETVLHVGTHSGFLVSNCTYEAIESDQLWVYAGAFN